MDVILTAVLTLGGIAVGLAVILVLVNKKLFVHQDPRIDIVEEMLPGSNCGACGFPGCRALSEALVDGDALPGKCTVSSDDGRQGIAAYLGVDVGAQEKVVARLACAGGINVSRKRALYQGMETCRAAAMVGGGGKSCSWGCLGLSDCADVCDFDAITMNEFCLPVVDPDKCTACGDCVEVCPKNLFELHPVSHQIWVACRSLEAGDDVLEDCEVACTACGRCAMDAPGGVIQIVDNLPVVDYDRRHADTRVAIERCPTGAILWLNEGGAEKGRDARKVLRKLPLPMAAT
jgi:Na+-translocating ferredoxin:NAD+ oxidoreductase subunit B